MDGLSNKMSDLRVRISQNNPDIVALCETWVQDDVLNHKFYPSECLEIKGYNLYRYDNVGVIRGGIILYIKPNFDGGVCKDMMKTASNFEESAWHWVTFINDDKKTEKLLLGCVYRKGASSAQNNNELNHIIKEAANMNNLITICGDFNFPSISWASPIFSEDVTMEDEFVNTLDEAVLNQHVQDFTRKRGSDKPSLLDLVITDNHQTISKPVILEPYGNSDHSLISWKSTFLCTVSPVIDVEPKPNFFKANYQHMRGDFEKMDWEDIFKDCRSINELVTKFNDIVQDKIKKHVPMKNKKTNSNKNNVPWMNRKALRAIKRNYHAWRRYTETKNHAKYLEYVKERNRVSKKLRHAKREFEKNIAKECKTNPKAFYSYFNSFKNRHTNFIRLKKQATATSDFTENDSDTAEEFNDYFRTVFSVDNDSELPEIPTPPCSLEDIDITIDDVYELLTKVNPTKSAGDDGIHPRVLKECASELATPIYMIFKQSLKDGSVPDAWKRATITPIFKSEERSKAENYRPISITSQLGKLLEKHIRKQLMDYLTDNNILSEHQHGFCNKRSCMTNLLEALDEITELVDEGMCVDEVFLDFRKAFDKVSHMKLLHKLKSIGVKGLLLNWISSFLIGRLQRVKVNSAYSSWGDVSSGVPQGSVLGPVLFIVFINDLPLGIKTNCKLFADDSKIYGKAVTDEDCQLIQEDLDACYKWANLWSMQFHPKKCKVMHFGRNNRKHIYLMGNNLINVTKEEKDLGITITDNLNWKRQTAICVKKANRTIGMIKHTFSHIDKDMFITLYSTLVRPQLEYCPQIWSPYHKGNINLLERVQRRATKMVPELHHLPYEERLANLKLYPLADRRRRGDMIATYKILHGMTDCNQEKLIPLHINPAKSTRSNNMQIKQKISRSNMRHNFYTHRIVLPWNELSNYTINSKTVDEFKVRYDKEVLGHYLVNN